MNPRLVALVGQPLGHSLSPAMHNAAFRAQGLDLVYIAMPTPPEHLSAVVTRLAAVGAVGANITVPHKEAVVALCDVLTPEAELIGAVNTLHWTADGLVGDNTDAHGLGAVIRDDLAAPSAAPVVILGTGGAARAAAVAFGRAHGHVTVVGRRAAAAAAVAGLAERAGSASAGSLHLDDVSAVAQRVQDAVIVVNATTLGLAGEQLPDPFTLLRAGQQALDLIYNPAETPWLAAARARGAEPHHGLGMLVGQACAAYELWTGQPAPAATMSATALAILTGHRARDAGTNA